jgi:hypothetical protein
VQVLREDGSLMLAANEEHRSHFLPLATSVRSSCSRSPFVAASFLMAYFTLSMERT